MTNARDIQVADGVLSYKECRQWICYATKMTDGELSILGMNKKQITTLGHSLANNRLLNPPKERPVKTTTFRCKRCAQVFLDTYVTKHPEYCPNCRR